MNSDVKDKINKPSARDRYFGALFVLAAVAAQELAMGNAALLLSVGLVMAYVLWVGTRWADSPGDVLPMTLLAIAVQCVHFTEEYLTGFQCRFPLLMGYVWSDARFLTFNMTWLAIFVLAALGVYRRVALAYLVILFLALAGGLGNGIGHLLLCVRQGGYFPGAITAPICLLVGIGLLAKLFGRSSVPQGQD